MPDHPQNPGNEIYGSVYEKNSVVFRQGDAGDQMFVIQNGAVEVSQRRGDEEKVLAILEKGDIFGEMALISGRPRSATVTTIQRSRLLPLSRGMLLEKIGQAPETALHLLKVLIRRIHLADRRINDMLAGSAGLRHLAGQPSPAGDVESSSLAPAAGEQAVEASADLDLSFQDMAAVWRAGGESVTVEAGRVIFSEGDPADGMYVIADGRVEISRCVTGVTSVLALLHPHDLLGEMALISGGARSATARALETTHLIPIRPSTFSDRIRREPRLALFLLQCLILKLHQKESAGRSVASAARQLRRGLLPLLKRADRPRLAIVSLSSCGGGAAVLLDDRTAFERILELADVIYHPMLIDAERIPESDIILVDGGVRVKEDIEKLYEARRKSRWLVAFGTCAVYGGIPALANRFELEALIEASYGRSQDLFAYYLNAHRGVQTGTFQESGLALTRRFWRLSDHARIDYYLPGCPPPAQLLEQLLRELRGESVEKPRPIVCAACGRKAARQANGGLTAMSAGAPDPAVCLLSQGVCCLGFLTRGGCGAACTHAGVPCWGCRGPSDKVLQKMNAGETLTDLLVQRMVRLCRVERADAAASARRFILQTNPALNDESSSLRCDGANIR